jgi:rRNA-processing protein FCF1
MSQFEYGVDLRSELVRIVHGPIELLIPTGALAELRFHSGKGGKKASAARFVLQNIGSYRRYFSAADVESAGALDEWILKYAVENHVCVATNDVPLRARLLASGVQVIAVKGKSKLDFV